MSYHGLIPMLQDHLIGLQHKPCVLEIGVDRGVTLIPLVVAMASCHDSWSYIGVDIQVQESVRLTVGYLGQSVAKSTYLIQENSLEFLPKAISSGLKFDVVLLDGDHNYYTVSKELKLIENLLNPESIIVVDDYSGRWSERDLFYANRSGYENNELSTKPVETEKHGVKAAVDEWLGENPQWKLIQPIPGTEPVILLRQN